MSNQCGCLNGGKCINHILMICECTGGFIGEQCEEIYIDFLEKNQPLENVQIIIVVAIVMCVVFASFVVCFFTWRRLKSVRKRRQEMSLMRNRRQSKATIEGSSVMPGWDSFSRSSSSTSETPTQLVPCQNNRSNTIFEKDRSLHLIVGYTGRVEV